MLGVDIYLTGSIATRSIIGSSIRRVVVRGNTLVGNRAGLPHRDAARRFAHVEEGLTSFDGLAIYVAKRIYCHEYSS